MRLKSPWHCIPDMGSGRDDGSALCLSVGQTTNHTSMNLVGPSRMAFLGHGIIYKAVFGSKGDNVRNPSTAFLHKMQVVQVLWPITYWIPLKSGSFFLCLPPILKQGKIRWNPRIWTPVAQSMPPMWTLIRNHPLLPNQSCSGRCNQIFLKGLNWIELIEWQVLSPTDVLALWIWPATSVPLQCPIAPPPSSRLVSVSQFWIQLWATPGIPPVSHLRASSIHRFQNHE